MKNLPSFSVGKSKFHVALIPKYRYKIFSHRRIKAFCEHNFKQISKKYNFKIDEMGFDIDHTHLILSLPPYLSVTKAIKLLKGRSARALFKAFPWFRRKYFWSNKLWSPAYYFDSIG